MEEEKEEIYIPNSRNESENSNPKELDVIMSISEFDANFSR